MQLSRHPNCVDPIYCPHCGKSINDEEPKLPKGCKCNPMDWGNPYDIKKVCSGPFEEDEYGLCKKCEHLKECHEK